MKVKEESEKVGLAQHSEKEDHGIWAHHFMANRCGNSERLYFWGLQNHCRWWLQPWNLKTLAPWKKSYDQHQFSSVTQSCPIYRDPMDYSMLVLPVHHQLPEFTQTHVHWVGDALQPSHPLLSPSFPTFNVSQHQGLFQWVSSSHQLAKVLEFQLQHQSFQWIFRTDYL